MPDVRAKRRSQRGRQQRKQRHERKEVWCLVVGILLGAGAVGFLVAAVIRIIGVDEVSNGWKLFALAGGMIGGGVVGANATYRFALPRLR